MTCASHHPACDCREAQLDTLIKALQEQVKGYQQGYESYKARCFKAEKEIEDAYERGRIAGLEQAARIADTEVSSLDEGSAAFAAAGIRALAAKKKGEEK